MATQLQPDNAQPPIDCSPEEWQARLDLAACYRIFDHMGWCEGIYNHITLRIPGEREAFLTSEWPVLRQRITRLGISPAELLAENS